MDSLAFPEARGRRPFGTSRPDAGDALTRFLRAEARRRFDWRAAHCLLLPADWIVACGGADPARDWRWISSEAVARRALTRCGGASGLAAQAMRGFEQLPTHAVRRGDVGIVTVLSPEGPAEVGAICTGGRWAVRAGRGLWIGRAEPRAAWRAFGPAGEA